MFLNKCDAIDYDDDIIDLAKIDVCHQLYVSGVPYDKLKFIAGSALDAARGQVEAGIAALEELLIHIVTYMP